MRQSVYDDTEKGFMKYIKHLTPGSCIDGHQPPPQISSQDLKSEYPPEPVTQSVTIPRFSNDTNNNNKPSLRI